MLRNNSTVINLIIWLFMVIFASSCASNQTKPTYVVDEPNAISSIESITMLPIVSVADIPEDDSSSLMNALHERLAVELALKGYVLQKADRFSVDEEILPEEINNMSVDELALLGPKDSEYLIVCFLREFDTSNIVIAQSARVRISAVLIDKKNKRFLWKNGAESFFNSPGFLWAAMLREDIIAVVQSFKKLFSSFPEKSIK